MVVRLQDVGSGVGIGYYVVYVGIALTRRRIQLGCALDAWRTTYERLHVSRQIDGQDRRRDTIQQDCDCELRASSRTPSNQPNPGSHQQRPEHKQIRPHLTLMWEDSGDVAV